MSLTGLPLAIAMAAKAHEGRTDRQGRPYIAHPVRVMLAVESDDERIVAVLHDSIEWGNLKRKHIEHAGFSDEVVEAIDALTKRDGESLHDYCARILANPLALTIKLEDLRDNAAPWRVKDMPKKARASYSAMYEQTALELGTTIDDVLSGKAKKRLLKKSKRSES